MPGIGSLVVDLQMRMAQFQQQSETATKSLQGIESTAIRVTGALKGIAAVIVGGLAINELAQQFRALIDVADEIGDVGAAFGLTTEQVTAFRGVAKVVGLEAQDLITIFAKFSQRLREAGGGDAQALEDLKALGVTMDDIKSKDFDAVLRKALAGLDNLKGGADKVALLRENFGKTGFAMDEFASKIERLTPEVGKLGAKFSGELSENADKFKEQLSLIAINGEKLKVAILSDLLPALNRLTEEFLNAKREGGGFLDGLTRVLRRFELGGSDIQVAEENLRKFAVQLGQVDKQIANSGTEERRSWFEKQREKLLADIESQKALIKVMTDPGIITGQAAAGGEKVAAPARVDVAKARAEADKAAAAEKALEAERQRLREMGSAAQVKFIEEQFAREKQLQEDEIKLAEERAAAEEEIRTKIRDGWVAYAQAIIEQDEKMAQAIADAAMATKETNDIAKELGLTFSSAFEDAILKGERLSDVLKGLSQDIGRIILRKTVTEPLADGISKTVKESGIGTSIGNFFKNLFRADGGPVAGGSAYIVGERGPELFVPGSSGMVVPNHALKSSGGGVTVINQFVDVAAEVRSQIAAATPSLIRAAAMQAADMKRRGGSFGAAFG